MQHFFNFENKIKKKKPPIIFYSFKIATCKVFSTIRGTFLEKLRSLAQKLKENIDY